MVGDEGYSRLKFECHCGKSFYSSKSLIMHKKIHSGLTKCNICDAILSRTYSLKRHLRLKHPQGSADDL